MISTSVRSAFGAEVARHVEYAASILMKMPREPNDVGVAINDDGALALMWLEFDDAATTLRELGATEDWIADLRPADPTLTPIAVRIPEGHLVSVFIAKTTSKGGTA